MAITSTPACTIGKSWVLMLPTMSRPIPWMPNTCSMITVPPISRPNDTPASVISENDDGLSASLNRIRRTGMPLALAALM